MGSRKSAEAESGSGSVSSNSETVVENPNAGGKVLLVQKEGGKEFRITVPANATITFGPWSPPTSKERAYGDNRSSQGTLRIYEGPKSTASIIAVFSGVASFRDVSIDYMEAVATQEVRKLWKSDKDGYVSEEEGKFGKQWVKQGDPLLETSESEDEDKPF